MIKDIKVDIEEHFQNGWTETPIQWETVNFDIVDRFISLKLIPITSESNSCKRVFNNLQLQVLAYDTNSTRVIDLSDKIREFIGCIDLPTCYFNVGSFDGIGVVPLENGIFFLNNVFEVNSSH